MQEYYYLRVTKDYADSVIQDLLKMKAVELLALDEVSIPKWQQQETLTRLKTLEKNPEIGVGWETAISRINAMTK